MKKTNGILIAFVFGMCMPLAFAQNSTSPTDGEPQSADRTTVEQISEDGTIKVEIQSDLPKTGSVLSVSLRFLDVVTNMPISNVNYDIVAIQDGETVLSEIGAFAEKGVKTHMTSSLSNDSQVEVMVVLQGIGENAPLSGPIGETIDVKIAPEFGSIVVMMLTWSIVAGIILSKIMLVPRIK